MTEVLCKVCGGAITLESILCGKCHTPHHEACITYNGGCAIFGCDTNTYLKPIYNTHGAVIDITTFPLEKKKEETAMIKKEGDVALVVQEDIVSLFFDVYKRKKKNHKGTQEELYALTFSELDIIDARVQNLLSAVQKKAEVIDTEKRSICPWMVLFSLIGIPAGAVAGGVAGGIAGTGAGIYLGKKGCEIFGCNSKCIADRETLIKQYQQKITDLSKSTKGDLS